jgi:CRP/FNR family transcriptional regulator, dissimilatory nitrate respiration regulator
MIAPELLRLAERLGAPRRALAGGEALFHQGDPARALYVVESGRLRLVRHTAAGETVTLHVARPGSLLAEAALHSDRYHCDARADLASRVLELEAAGVRGALAADPALALAFTGALCREVQRLRALLELRSLRGAADRLLAYLAWRGEAELDLPLKDVASELGLTPEAVYRSAARLEREGRVVRRGRRLGLPDRA